MDIAIEVEEIDASALESLKEHGLTTLKNDRFSGSTELVTALVALTPTTLAAITTVVVQLIRANRHVRIITKKVRIEGLSEKRAIEVLRALNETHE